jgi:hypothetical protein
MPSLVRMNLKYIFLVVISAMCARMQAQIPVNSPYSRFGIGLTDIGFNPRYSALGNASIALPDLSGVNLTNPASFALFAETTFQGSVYAKSSQLLSSTGQTNYLGGQVGEIAFGFKRAGSKWGFAMGISPESVVGYQFSNTYSLNDSLRANYSYTGEGGMNKVQMGFARTFILYSDSTNANTHTLSLGANLNFRFGSILQVDRILFDNTSIYNSKITNRKSFSDANFTFGAHYSFPIHQRKAAGKVTQSTWFHLAGTYELENNVNPSVQDIRQSTRTVSGIELAVLTVLDTTYTNLSFVLPQRIQLGAAVTHEFKKGGTLSLSGSYRQQDWKSVEDLNSLIRASNQSFHNSKSVGLGLEYVPNANGGENNYFGACTYRLGMKSGESYVGLNGNNIIQEAFTCGVQMPMRSSKTTSSLSLSAEFGTYGNATEIATKENYASFLIGFKLHPFERWFVQRKYD